VSKVSTFLTVLGDRKEFGNSIEEKTTTIHSL